MHTVFLTSNLNIGGAQKNLAHMANNLICQHEVTIISFSKNSCQYQLSERIKVIGCDRSIFKLVYKACSKEIRNASHLIIFNYLLLFLSFFFSKETKIILRFINNYSAQEKNWIRALTYDFLLRVTKKRTYCYIAQCHSMKAEMRNKLGRHAPITVLYNPIIYNGNNNQKIYDFIYIGKLTSQKDPLKALAMLNAYKKKYGKFNAIFIGDGYLRNRFLLEIKKLELESEVTWIGVSTEIDNLLRQSKVCMSTSTYEGFPNVLLEALSHCVPVVSSSFDHGLDEIISSQKIGKIVQADSTNADFEYVEALRDYLYLQVRGEDFASALAKFSIDEYSKNLRSILL